MIILIKDCEDLLRKGFLELLDEIARDKETRDTRKGCIDTCDS
jgi:hypothetical protein